MLGKHVLTSPPYTIPNTKYQQEGGERKRDWAIPKARNDGIRCSRRDVSSVRWPVPTCFPCVSVLWTHPAAGERSARKERCLDACLFSSSTVAFDTLIIRGILR